MALLYFRRCTVGHPSSSHHGRNIHRPPHRSRQLRAVAAWSTLHQRRGGAKENGRKSWVHQGWREGWGWAQREPDIGEERWPSAHLTPDAPPHTVAQNSAPPAQDAGRSALRPQIPAPAPRRGRSPPFCGGGRWEIASSAPSSEVVPPGLRTMTRTNGGRGALRRGGMPLQARRAEEFGWMSTGWQCYTRESEAGLGAKRPPLCTPPKLHCTRPYFPTLDPVSIAHGG